MDAESPKPKIGLLFSERTTPVQSLDLRIPLTPAHWRLVRDLSAKLGASLGTTVSYLLNVGIERHLECAKQDTTPD